MATHHKELVPKHKATHKGVGAHCLPVAGDAVTPPSRGKPGIDTVFPPTRNRPGGDFIAHNGTGHGGKAGPA